MMIFLWFAWNDQKCDQILDFCTTADRSHGCPSDTNNNHYSTIVRNIMWEMFLFFFFLFFISHLEVGYFKKVLLRETRNQNQDWSWQAIFM